jgi:hypothetical protein
MKPYQLHHRVHEEWGEQSLHFWFFAFSASYDLEELRNALKGVLAEHRVTAYASYELVGQYDLMLRVWLPYARVKAFRVSLRDALSPLSLVLDDLFTVESHVRHWPWASLPNKRGPIIPVNTELLSTRPTDGQLEQMNELCVGEGRESLSQDLARFKDGGLLREALPGPGIKLVTLVNPTGTVSNPKRIALQKQIARVLDESDPETFSDCSLYAVDGHAALFLILCRVHSDCFGELRAKLFDALQLPLLGEARTTTYPIVSSEFLPITDAISLGAPGGDVEDRSTIVDLLGDDESHILEVKATAFAPIDPWLRDGRDLEESPKFFDRGILKSVAAFLNSDGGTIVVGALEGERYRGLSDGVSKRLDSFPSIGQYVCCGLVDPTFTSGSWDKFERKVLDLLGSRLTPNASGLVRISREQYHRKSLCVIRVLPSGDAWYYAQTSETQPAAFYIRDGARVLELQATDADEYKKRHRSEQKET